MGSCFRLIDKADVVVFSRLRQDHVRRGRRGYYALEVGKPVFEIRNGRIVPLKQTVRFIRRKATVNLYETFRSRYGRYPSLSY